MSDSIDILRDEAGVLYWFTPYGAYPLVYLTRSNEVLCADCANRPADCYSEPAVCGDVYLEGGPLECFECDAMIESKCGSVDDDTEDDAS